MGSELFWSEIVTVERFRYDWAGMIAPGYQWLSPGTRR